MSIEETMDRLATNVAMIAGAISTLAEAVNGTYKGNPIYRDHSKEPSVPPTDDAKPSKARAWDQMANPPVIVGPQTLDEAWTFDAWTFRSLNSVPDNESSESRGGITVEKLREARRIMEQETVPSETRGTGPDYELHVPGTVDATLDERGVNYGDFTDNASIAQNIKLAMRNSPQWEEIDDAFILEALDLIASKIGRLLSGNPYWKDGWHDIQGYAKLVEQRIEINGANDNDD